MAPIRRYLRITKYSVLEVRIYLDNPLLAHTWLLNERSPVLPRVIEAVRPLVLPKLREENERAKGKGGGKKKGVKDVITEEDFEVSIFLTDTSTRHSLLTKQKIVREKGKHRMQSNSSKLTGNTNDQPIEVEDGGSNEAADAMRGVSNTHETPVILREESGDEAGLDQIPPANEITEEAEEEMGPHRRPKRQRTTRQDADDESEGSLSGEGEEMDEDSDFEMRPSKRSKSGAEATVLIEEEDDGESVGTDDKKKMAMETRYEGFAIWGRVLCLVIKRRYADKSRGRPGFGGGGSAMMEHWIARTQMAGGEDEG